MAVDRDHPGNVPDHPNPVAGMVHNAAGMVDTLAERVKKTMPPLPVLEEPRIDAHELD